MFIKTRRKLSTSPLRNQQRARPNAVFHSFSRTALSSIATVAQAFFVARRTRNIFLATACLAPIVLSVCCAPPSLSDAHRALLAERVATSTSEVVYTGKVSMLTATGNAPQLYEYERRAEQEIISHITKTPSGEVVVFQGVRLSDDGGLLELELIHAQLGLVSKATLQDGVATLSSTIGEAAPETIELNADDDVVVGPTLFQYLLDHRNDLREGHEFDFLSVENRGVFRFFAETRERPNVFHVRPVDPIISLLVAPIVVTYDDSTQQFISYQGPVPPRGPDGEAFDGLVAYESNMAFR